MDCERIKGNKKVQRILKGGGLIDYLEHLCGWDTNVIVRFAERWKDSSIFLFGRRVAVNGNFIAKVTSMLTDGNKFYRYRKLSKLVVHKFPKMDQEWDEPEERGTKTSYDLAKIENIWGQVLIFLMHYITLDSHFTRFLGHHFDLLNHFHQHTKVCVPFYL